MSDAEAVVYVVDDDDAMRGSMTYLFASVGLLSQTFETAAAFLDVWPTIDRNRLGCIVLDVRMPGMSGLELLRRLVEKRCDLPVLIVTGHGDVPMAVSALKAGALDFIEKPFKEQYLLDAVDAAIRLCRDRLTANVTRRSIEDRLKRLGRRENEVRERVLQGKPNKVIAHELDLAIKTIEAYRSAVMLKMEAGSVAELAQLMATLR